MEDSRDITQVKGMEEAFLEDAVVLGETVAALMAVLAVLVQGWANKMEPGNRFEATVSMPTPDSSKKKSLSSQRCYIMVSRMAQAGGSASETTLLDVVMIVRPC